MAGNYRFYNQNEEDVLPYKDNYVETGAENQDFYQGQQAAEAPVASVSRSRAEPEDVTNYYQNPVEDYVKPMPDNLTYPAYSLIPKERLADPSRPLPYDINPADWKTGDDATDAERNQRKMVRNYTQQLYEEMAKTGDIDAARKEAARNVNLANVGQGLEQMFKSRSVAHGGPGVDTAYWDAQRKGAQTGVDNAELDRRRKIEDYITKKKLGSESVSELQQMKELDTKNNMNDPESNVSRAYQQSFKLSYGDSFNTSDPETGDEYNAIDTMSANDIMSASKMMEGKARLDLNEKLGYAKLAERGDTGEVSPKTQAEIANINARTATEEARKKNLERPPVVKPGAAARPEAGGGVSDSDFSTDKRFIATALKEKKALAEYERATKDALESFSEGGNYGLWEGYAPAVEIGGKNITGGKRSEHNAYLAKIATQVIDKVPGIRSDSDFQNLVKPMLPSPGDPKDVVKKKLSIFENFLRARRPETTTYDMLPDDDKARLEGKNITSPLPTQKESTQEEQTMLPPPKGEIEVTQNGKTYRWNGYQYVQKGGK
jgi:hypothetical protein